MKAYLEIEMPTSCEDCPMGFSVNFGILRTPTHNIVGDGEISKKQGFCPLVPVSPHGRLIEMHDVFKLISAFPEVDKLLPVEFMKALYNLPTIIPAEEETCTKM